MNNSKKTSLSQAAITGGNELARQMLQGLRRQAAGEFKESADSDETVEVIAAKIQTDMRLPADRASYAILLGYGLAPYFPTIEALVATKAFVIIRGRNGDDPSVLGHVLADVIADEAERVAFNPYNVGSEDRVVVLADAGLRHSSRSVAPIAQAAERGLPVFSTLSADEKAPDALAGADIEVHLPPMTAEMLTLLFEAAHDEVPADILNFTAAEKLRTENLVAHIRRGRAAAECLSGLQQAVNPPKTESKTQTILLGDLAGYGEAKTWGLELAQDLELWRQGRLSWAEVDHRAVVLAGPPGTGKTSFAGVLAATLRVPLIATSVAEWNARDNLSGTLRRMQAVFEQAVTQAPSILFVDELDGISSRVSIGAG